MFCFSHFQIWLKAQTGLPHHYILHYNHQKYVSPYCSGWRLTHLFSHNGPYQQSNNCCANTCESAPWSVDILPDLLSSYPPCWPFCCVVTQGLAGAGAALALSLILCANSMMVNMWLLCLFCPNVHVVVVHMGSSTNKVLIILTVL